MTAAANTLNWDTVFAIPVPDVNSAIISKNSTPASFSYTSPKNDVISGSFDPWQIVKGGDGALVWMSIPVKQVSGSCELGSFSWAQGELIVEVHLEYIPHTQNELMQDLKLKTTSSDPENPAISLKTTLFTQPITGDAVDNAGKDIVEPVVSTLVIDWLNQNLVDFDHVFTTVNLNKTLDKSAQWAWCKPSYTDYAYCDAPTLDQSILSVLCMTGGRSAGSGQLQQIDPYVITSGNRAGYLVSPARFLNDLMLPTLKFSWKNASDDDFEVISNADTQTGKYEHVLRIKQGHSIRLDDVEKDGSTYTPYMIEMSVATDGDQLVFNTHTTTDIGMGVTHWCKTTHWYQITLGENKNGQTLVYKEIQPAVVEHGTQASEGTKILEWMIIIAGAIATIVLGVMTDGAAFAVGAIIIGCLTGIYAASPDIIQAVDKGTAPDVSLLTLNVSDPIQWSAKKVFELTSAQFNDALQLGGELLSDLVFKP